MKSGIRCTHNLGVRSEKINKIWMLPELRRKKIRPAKEILRKEKERKRRDKAILKRLVDRKIGQVSSSFDRGWALILWGHRGQPLPSYPVGYNGRGLRLRFQTMGAKIRSNH